MMMRHAGWVLIVLTASMLGLGAHSQNAGNNRHLGVASCASSVCHGKNKAQPDRHVGLNEYRIWMDQDLHAQAYRVLDSAKSKQIALKMGLPSASGAKICLDCHSDNVPQAMQGPKFHLSDGVGCEACHGGSEKWIETHAQTTATHAANIERGMYPSEKPLRRAELCLSCHLGRNDKFATHVIMGAGHPRLSFELEAFTANQPAHFTVDADYLERKGKIEGMNLWLTGQLENAERSVTLLQGPLLTPGGMIPELAFYDCYACHHSMESTRWSQSRAGPGIKPGTLRLQRQSIVMMQAVIDALGTPEALAQLRNATDDLVRAGQSDPAGLRSAAQKVLEQLHGLEPWAQRSYTPAEVAKVRKALLRYAAEDKAADFVVAEQVVLGVESLSHTLADYERRKASLDSLFAAVKKGSDFNPTQFADTAKRMVEQY